MDGNAKPSDPLVPKDKRTANLIQWPKGVSGNPQGGARVQREFQAAIRRMSDKGKDLLDYLFENLRNPRAHPMIRFKCVEMLVRYGYGEPRKADDAKQTEPVIDMSKLTNEDLDKLSEIHAKLKGLPQRQPGEVIDVEGDEK